MPTLKFLEEHSKVLELPRDATHGFQNGFFETFENVMKNIELGEDELDPTDTDQITSKLLRTGPCPNSSRVYYKLTTTPDHPFHDEVVSEFLGTSLDNELTRRELGDRFEEWIDEANRALNRWLEELDESAIHNADIPDSIADFYLNRMEKIRKKAGELDVELRELKMTVDQVYSTQYFYPANPDGAWLLKDSGKLGGGVFESKLSSLPKTIDKHVLTGYATYIEKSEMVPIEIGIYLYTDENNSELHLDGFYINDNFRSEIRNNLTRFATLVQQSKEQGRWEEGGQIEERLIEPPEPEYVSYCEDCLFSGVCHGE